MMTEHKPLKNVYTAILEYNDKMCKGLGTDNALDALTIVKTIRERLDFSDEMNALEAVNIMINDNSEMVKVLEKFRKNCREQKTENKRLKRQKSVLNFRLAALKDEIESQNNEIESLNIQILQLRKLHEDSVVENMRLRESRS